MHGPTSWGDGESWPGGGGCLKTELVQRIATLLGGSGQCNSCVVCCVVWCSVVLCCVVWCGVDCVVWCGVVCRKRCYQKAIAGMSTHGYR